MGGKSEKEVYINIQRKVNFVGTRKIGIDSGPLVDMIDNPMFFLVQTLKMFNKKDLFYTHNICLGEVIDCLVEKKDMDREEAREKVSKFVKEYNITVIEDKDVEWAFYNHLKDICKKNNVEFHPPDSFILYQFKKNGINKIWSTNNHFLDAGRLFGMDCEKFYHFEKELNNKLREFFRKQYYHKKKRR